MVTVKIDGKRYDSVDRWSDLTLGKFIELSQIELPKKLKELYYLSTKLNNQDPKELEAAKVEYDKFAESITRTDLVRHFPAYYGKVMELLTDIPASVIKNVHADLRSSFFDKYLRIFVLSMIYDFPVDNVGDEIQLYQPPDLDKIVIDKEEYLFPKTLRIGDQDILMGKEPIVSFTEASDIDLAIQSLLEDGVKSLPLIVSIYCRKEGEEYDQDTALERQGLFLKAKMDEVWSLFFCIGVHTAKFLINSGIYSRGVLEVLKQVV